LGRPFWAAYASDRAWFSGDRSVPCSRRALFTAAGSRGPPRARAGRAREVGRAPLEIG
jgi:hypothetical protein